MLSTLYHIIIYPLQLLLETIFSLIYIRSCRNIELTILTISFAVSLFCLPFYNRAEKMQKEEKDVQNKMKCKLEQIKKTFKGSEKFMMVAAYQKQNNYHPLMALRGVFSLLIQIPFFIAAYLFFSHLQINAQTTIFNTINIFKPDGILVFNEFSINLLPIIMTIINIISCEIYLHTEPFKERVQPYITALIFLILLYNSPAILVLYWTLNNLFSLLKNIALKMNNPKKILYILCASILLGLFIGTWKYYSCFSYLRKIVILLLFGFGIIAIFSLKKFINNQKNILENLSEQKFINIIFLLSCISMFVLLGFVIPSKIISSDIFAFYFGQTYTSPLKILKYQLIHTFGIFLFWLPCLYFFTPKFYRPIFSIVSLGITAFTFFQIIFNFKPIMVDTEFKFNTTNMQAVGGNYFIKFVNLLFLIFLTCVSYFISKYKKIKFLYIFLFIIISSGLVYFSNNALKMYEQIKSNPNHTNENYKIHLSKKGKNVIVIFLDRAMGNFLPYALKERAEFKNIYSGFTFYPNTISYAKHTILTYPSLMGGYEYIPEKLVKDSRLMKDKHNEAMLVLPVLFKNNGYNVFVSDSSWVDYKEFADKTMFEKYGIHYGALTEKYIKKLDYAADSKTIDTKILKTSRNLLFFTFLKTSPNIFKGTIYNNGKYHELLLKNGAQNNINSDNYSVSNLLPDYYTAQNNVIKGNYLVLKGLPEITDFNSEKNSFVVINNELSHSHTVLEYPNYTIGPIKHKPPNITKGNLITYEYYNTFMSSMILIGKYLEYLKTNDLYDNSRIIIVADHGNIFAKFKNMPSEQDIPMDFNPILLVKDFNEKGQLKTDKTFMTNAELPIIASKNIINNAYNPFSKKPFVSEKEKEVHIMTEGDWHPDYYNKSDFPLGKFFLILKGDIYKKENFEYLEVK